MSARKLIALGLSFICFIKLYAQQKEVPVEIVVDKLSHKNIRGFLEVKTEAAYKFYYDEAVPANCITNKCISIKSSDKEVSVNTASDPAFSTSRMLRVFKINPSSGKISIKMETYKNDKGDPCEYDKKDADHSIVPLEIKLSDLNPGVFSAPFTVVAKDEKFTAVIRVRYGIPAPADITQEKAEKVNDATKALTFKSLIDLGNKNNLGYLWEYRIGEDTAWKEFGKTVSESVVFFPNRDIFKKEIRVNQLIHLRMKAVSPELQGPSSNSVDIQCTPGAPQISDNDVSLISTCPNSPSGGLSIKSIAGSADNFSFYFLKGKTVESGNFPDSVAVANKLSPGTVAGNKPILVQSLEDGDYMLVIYNANMPVGKVFATHAFSVSKYPVLTIKSQEAKGVTCSGAPEGQIMIEMAGGNPGKLVFSISPAVGKVRQYDRTAIFSELLPGSYSVFVKDECGQLVATKELEIAVKAPPIKGKVSTATEPINDFSNGSVNVALEGGSGHFKYILSKGSNTEPEKTASAASWVIEHLAKGNYKLKIIDTDFPQCPGWDTSFTLIGKTVIADSASQPEKKDTIHLNKPTNGVDTLRKANSRNNKSSLDDVLWGIKVTHLPFKSYINKGEESCIAGNNQYCVIMYQSKSRLSV